jgi:hypothetical protein
MTLTEFKERLVNVAPAGTVLNNPGGGTSIITGHGDKKISYKRGRSTIYVSYDDLLSAYNRFQGTKITTADLKVFLPCVFDSTARPAGHSCNCTMFFLLFQKIGLAGILEGDGVRGNPFAAELV